MPHNDRISLTPHPPLLREAQPGQRHSGSDSLGRQGWGNFGSLEDASVGQTGPVLAMGSHQAKPQGSVELELVRLPKAGKAEGRFPFLC